MGIKTGPRTKKRSAKNVSDDIQPRANFIRFYVEQDFKNAAGAYEKAFGCTHESAIAGASRLLKDDNVQKDLSKELQKILKEKRRPLEKRILDVWVKRAFFDPTEIVDLSGKLVITEKELRDQGLQVCIDSVNQKLNAQGDTYLEYKFADRDKALDMLQKYIQMIKAPDMKITGKNGEDDMCLKVSFVDPEKKDDEKDKE